MTIRNHVTRYTAEKLLDLAAVVGATVLIWAVVALLLGFDPVSP